MFEFDEDFKFYQLKDKFEYILAIKEISNIKQIKIRFSLDGVILSKVTDELEGGVVRRTTSNKTLTIENNKVINTEQYIPLKGITIPNKSETSYIVNPNIGAIDIETYTATNNTTKVYALGFRTNLNENIQTYYIDTQIKNYSEIILNLIDELFKSKYENIIFYCHNLGGFDVVFILKVLYDYNDLHESKYNV